MKILLVALLIATVCGNEALNINKEDFEGYDEEDDEILKPNEESDSSEEYKKNLEEGNDFEGDIKLDSYVKKLESTGNKISKRGYLVAEAIRRKWKDQTVYYQISPSLVAKKIVRRAIKHVEGKTCLKFVEAKHHLGYIEFQDGDGCSSHLGRTGMKPQPVEVANGCGFGAAVHEILHALGFLHEQSRNDRDKYVKVEENHILKAERHNFKKYEHVTPHDAGYDYGSLMHYEENAFGKLAWYKGFMGPYDTIKVLKEDKGSPYLIGQRSGLSDDDTNMILNFYGCTNRRRITNIARRRSSRRRWSGR